MGGAADAPSPCWLRPGTLTRVSAVAAVAVAGEGGSDAQGAFSVLGSCVLWIAALPAGQHILGIRLASQVAVSLEKLK